MTTPPNPTPIFPTPTPLGLATTAGVGGSLSNNDGYVLSFFLAGVTPLQALIYVRIVWGWVCGCVGGTTTSITDERPRVLKPLTLTPPHHHHHHHHHQQMSDPKC